MGDKSDGSKLLCLVRHGQGMHNPRLDLRFLWHLTQGNDPELTPRGETQAKEAKAALEEHMPSFEGVICSPLSRAIQTAHLLFGQSALPVTLCALMSERCCSAADVGTPRSLLEAHRPETDGWLGLNELEETWWSACPG